MAKVKINKGGKILIALFAVALIGVAIWIFLVPQKGEEEPVVPEFSDSSGAATEEGSTPTSTASNTPTTSPVGKADVITEGLGRPIRVGIVTWGGYAGGLHANNGFAPSSSSLFFKKYGLAIEFVVIDDYPASRAAFRKGGADGGVDIVWATVDSYALEYTTLKDARPKAFMQYDWSRGGDAIAVSKNIQKIRDLKGKRIAVAEGTPSHYFALYLLSQAKMTTTDVNWVFTASAVEAAALFRQGTVDAGVSWSPDVYMAAKDRKGGHILTSTREASSLIADIFLVRGDFSDQHADLVQKFAMGWFEGVDAVHKDPEPVKQIMAAGFEGVDAAAADGMLKDVKLPTYHENVQFFEINGNILRGYSDIYNEANKLWRGLGKTSGRTNASSTYTVDHLKAVRGQMETLFGKPVAAKIAPTKEFKFAPVKTKADKEKVEKAAPILTKRISIYFPSGKSTLDPNSKMILDEAASLAQTFGSVRMRVTGNTDSVGDRGYNLKLSQKRAKAVVRYLASKHDFPQEKFVAIGAGPDKPIADNRTDSGRQQNRRTDFEIIPGS